MKFKPSFNSQLPTRSYLDKLNVEPFVRYNNPTDRPTRPLEIPAATRFRHIYIAGATQHGKSTMLEHMIAQDMQNNEGITLLDPKGDLAESVLYRVPPHRLDDCIYIDIKDPIPINFMSWQSEQERQTLLADVYQTFLRFSTMTSGDQWLSILRWTIYTLLASQSASFLDIYYFLSRDDRQKVLLKEVARRNDDGRYDDIFHYWEKEYPHLKSPREGPIITRMSVFTTTPPLKKMLGTPAASLDIFQCMENRKILIVNLMGVGRDNGNLVGALMASKIQQAAFRRQPQEKHLRVPHYFYADEFQNFQTSDFDTILSEAGGFKLSLTLANQGLYQLEPKIRQSLFTNVTAARIAFRLNHEDISNWKHLWPDHQAQGAVAEFEERRRKMLAIAGTPDRQSNRPDVMIDPQSLAKLPPYVAFFKIGTEEGIIANTMRPLPAPTPEQIRNAKIIKKRTMGSYSCNAPPVSHTENNEHGSKPESKPDAIPADPKSPSVPSHQSKKRNPRTSR